MFFCMSQEHKLYLILYISGNSVLFKKKNIPEILPSLYWRGEENV